MHRNIRAIGCILLLFLENTRNVIFRLNVERCRNFNIPIMKKYYLAFTILGLFMTSCSTYYLTSSSFKEQLQNIDPNKINNDYDFRLGLLGVALKGEKNFYNGIGSLKCKDKYGNNFIFNIKPQTSIRLTDSTGRRI